ncbi:MAG: zinc-dependent metalloprotease [Flavobacteriales bacterium]|nr:zinc-dependent metalloprotease [Flavobacteriales bacterium]
MMKLIFSIFLTFSLTLSFTQNQSCYSDIRHKELMHNADYSQLIQNNESKIQQRLIQNMARSGPNDVLTIPVVVHVVHLGEAVGVGTNISDAQINSAINNLNDVYSNSGGGSVDTKIQFCLAQRDPNCNATTGIVRVSGAGVTNYLTEGIDANGSDGKGADEKSVKDLSRWPNNAYYNIWVVSEIDDNNGGAGTQGYAYFPGSSASFDGTVILHNAFGYDPGGTIGYELKSYTNRNSTTVHELGHGLNLYHTFQGDDSNNDGIADQCPTDAQCGVSGDCVNDTKKHQRITTCTSGSNSCDSGDITDVAHNFMGYASQTCRTQFTTGQKDRMRAALETLRPGLISSQGCVAPGASVTAATCSPTVSSPHSAVGVSSFKINDMTVNSSINDNGANISDFSCSHQTELEINTQYSLEVLHSVNNEVTKVYIDYNNDGDFSDAGEEIFSGTAASSHSGTFTTPASPTLDTYLRVRVMSDFFPYAINSPCQNLTLGEVEEYAVKIVDNTAPSGPTTQLVQEDCGSTVTAMGDVIYATAVPGATNYEWNIENSSEGIDYTGQIGSAYNGWRLTWVPGTQVNSSYNVKVKAYVNGTWGDYGDVCVVNTPNASSLPKTQLRASDCGSTLTALNDVFYCDPIPGATNYEWNIENAGLGINYTGQAGNAYNGWRLSWVPNVQMNASYNVKIKAYVGGSWGDYGNVCVITAPSNLPTTTVSAGDCGSTLPSLGDAVYCDPVPGATNYEWNIVNVGQGINHTEQIGSSYNGYRLSWVPGVQLNSSYTITVRAYVGGSWANFGGSCSVSTPSAAAHETTNVRTSDCGSTVTNMTDVIYCDRVVGATSYDWNIVNVGLGVNETINSGNAFHGFRMSWIPNVQLNTPYDIRVRAYVAGSVISYGATCQVTSAGSFKFLENQEASDNLEDVASNMVIYPNPNIGDRLNIALPASEDELVNLSIYNLLGEQVYVKDFRKGQDKTVLDIDMSYLDMSKGMYVVSAVVGDKKYQQKLNIR